MDKETFEAIINKYGEENIIGIGFDNSSGVTFGHNEEFSLSEHYDADLGLFTFTEFDMKGNPYIVIKCVSDVQAVMIKDANIDIGNYDRINIRG